MSRRAGAAGPILLAVATLAAIAGALALNAAGAVDRLEFQSIDTRFAVRGSQGAPKDVVVVGVDAKTFRQKAEGGIGEQWPFARKWHAQVIDELVRDGARGDRLRRAVHRGLADG